MLAPHLHNRPHSHVAASLLVSLGREPIRVQLAGHWITAEAVWAAPDVDQALDSDGPVAVLHLDPDHRAGRALRLQGPGGEFPLAEHPRFRACLNELAASPSAAAALAARATLEAGEPRPLDPRVVLACRACAGVTTPPAWAAPPWPRRWGCPNPVSGTFSARNSASISSASSCISNASGRSLCGVTA